MRSAFIAAAALAATVLAVPYEKRGVVTDTAVDVVYVTDYTTVTAGAAKPTAETVKAYYQPNKPSWWGQPHKQPHHYKHKHTQAKDTTTWAAPTTHAKDTTTWAAPTTHAAPPPPPKTPTSQRSAPASAPTDYASKVVLHHNVHRANHSAPNIAWDANLEASAKQVADSCVYAHNVAAMGGGYGQNIAAGVAADNITAIITNLFYNGEVGWYDGLYGQAQPSMSNFDHWGHFSQIVWKGTTQVGCYTKDCSGQGLANTGGNVAPYFTVCNYKSPGNFANEYGANVGSPLGHPTVDWNYGL